jgi:hypothetical protein
MNVIEFGPPAGRVLREEHKPFCQRTLPLRKAIGETLLEKRSFERFGVCPCQEWDDEREPWRLIRLASALGLPQTLIIFVTSRVN